MIFIASIKILKGRWRENTGKHKLWRHNMATLMRRKEIGNKNHIYAPSPMVKLFNILVWATRRTKSVRTVKQSFVRARMYTNTHKHTLMFTWLSHPGSAEDGQLHLRAFGHDSSCDERSSASQSVISEVSPKHPPSRKQRLRRWGNASTFSSTKHSRNISTIRSESQRKCSRKQAEVADYDWMWWKGNK